MLSCLYLSQTTNDNPRAKHAIVTAGQLAEFSLKVNTRTDILAKICIFCIKTITSEFTRLIE